MLLLTFMQLVPAQPIPRPRVANPPPSHSQSLTLTQPPKDYPRRLLGFRNSGSLIRKQQYSSSAHLQLLLNVCVQKYYIYDSCLLPNLKDRRMFRRILGITQIINNGEEEYFQATAYCHVTPCQAFCLQSLQNIVKPSKTHRAWLLDKIKHGLAIL